MHEFPGSKLTKEFYERAFGLPIYYQDDSSAIYNFGNTLINLLSVDDRGIQSILRDVGSDTLALALRGAEPEVQDKIMRNMSKRAAEILRDDMEARGPVKLAEVEAAQKEIVTIALRLAAEGTIYLGGMDEGEFV